MSVKNFTGSCRPENTKQLEQLIIKAVNDAQDKAQKAAAEQLKEVTGGLKIPGFSNVNQENLIESRYRSRVPMPSIT